MSNKRILRGKELLRHREASFSLGQSLNQMVIPHYDALVDPFLKAFFDPPALRRHLKATGVLPNKKRFSLANFKQRMNENTLSSASKKKAKSEANASCSLPKTPLVQLAQVITEERQIKTSQGSRYKKFYRSTELKL